MWFKCYFAVKFCHEFNFTINFPRNNFNDKVLNIAELSDVGDSRNMTGGCWLSGRRNVT